MPMHTSEKWSSIVGFPLYEISTAGRIRSYHIPGRSFRPRKKPRFMVMSPTVYGYLRVKLKAADGSLRDRYIHLLVLETFVSRRPAGCECRHLNGKRPDNRLVNLRWGTSMENAHDRQLHGTQAKGSKHGRSILNERQVRQIKKRLARGESATTIAKDYPTGRVTVTNIKLGNIWRHVK